MDCKILRNNRGITMLYVIAALLLAVAVGAALMKMTNVEMGSAGDFNGVTSAAFAAGSAMNSAESYMMDSSVKAVEKINAYITDKAPVSFIGGPTDLKSVDAAGTQKYYVQMTGWDPSNLTVQLTAVGYGKGGSKKSVSALFRIQNVTNTTSLAGVNHAFYLGTGISGATIHTALDVDGDTYLGSPATFTTSASGSRFRGTFRTAKAAPPAKFTFNPTAAFTMTFDRKAYFGSVLDLQGSVNLRFKDTTGLEYGFTGTGTNSLEMDGLVYFNTCGPVGAWEVFTVDSKGHDVAAKTDIKTSGKFYAPSGSTSNVDLLAPYSINPALDVQTALNLPVVEPKDPKVDATYFDPAKMYTWSTCMSWGLADNFSNSQGPITGKRLNQLYAKAVAETKLDHGFAVVKVDGFATIIDDDAAAFTGKVAFIVPSTGRLEVVTPAKFYQCAEGSRTLVFVASGGSAVLGGWSGDVDKCFKGFVNIDNGGSLTLGQTGVPAARMIGAIQVADNAAAFNYYPDPSMTNVDYDADVLKDFGPFLNTTGATSPGVPSELITVVTGMTTLNPILRSVLY